jgi:hypothetical protein
MMGTNINDLVSGLPRVECMTSYNGNCMPNQFIIKGDDWVMFQSYRSPIVLRKNGKTYLFRDWDYSRTTGKYRNMFLGECKAETLQKLKDGEYIAVDFEV